MRSKLIAIGFLGLLAACGGTGDDGEPGPAGTAGADGKPGAQGVAGPAGPAGTSTSVTPPEPPKEAPKAVYTLSNDATANAVFVYTRAADGTLSFLDSYATGGRGTASGLGDQGALAYDAARRIFVAVNAGDNSISMMALKLDGSLSLVSKIGSGGVRPISVTISGDLVYALNAGDATNAANISGFRISGGGLARIDGSTQPLSADQPGPAQISFDPSGKVLVVTEKGTNTIDTYVVTSGVAGAPSAQAAAGTTPFGFAFSESKHLVVSEAFGGAASAGATSSYVLSADGTLSVKSGSVTSNQSAPCWVAVAKNHAYVTNAASNTVTAYTIATDGSLSLVGDGANGQTGMGPIDLDATDGNDLLYTLNGREHTISVFAIGADGALTKKPDFKGLPEFAVGLVAR